MIKKCKECGAEFEALGEWQTLCRKCYYKQKPQKQQLKEQSNKEQYWQTKQLLDKEMLAYYTAKLTFDKEQSIRIIRQTALNNATKIAELTNIKSQQLIWELVDQCFDYLQTGTKPTIVKEEVIR